MQPSLKPRLDLTLVDSLAALLVPFMVVLLDHLGDQRELVASGRLWQDHSHHVVLQRFISVLFDSKALTHFSQNFCSFFGGLSLEDKLNKEFGSSLGEELTTLPRISLQALSESHELGVDV